MIEIYNVFIFNQIKWEGRDGSLKSIFASLELLMKPDCYKNLLLILIFWRRNHVKFY